MLGFDERLKNLTETVGDTAEVERVRKFVRYLPWKFAKTYADFCPHEYILRKFTWNKNEYNNLVRHIWKYGIDAYFGTKALPNRYWFNHEDGYYYFIFPEDTDAEGNPTDEAYIINRARIEDYPFWVEEGLEERRVRCRYGFGRKVEKAKAGDQSDDSTVSEDQSE